MAGSFAHPLHLPFWQAPKNEKKLPEKASSSKACIVQRSRGFKLCWFQTSCLDIEGCKSWPCHGSGLVPSVCSWQAPKNENKVSEKAGKACLMPLTPGIDGFFSTNSFLSSCEILYLPRSAPFCVCLQSDHCRWMCVLWREKE